MTPTERAAQVVKRHDDSALNDSMLLPADIEERIVAAIMSGRLVTHW